MLQTYTVYFQKKTTFSFSESSDECPSKDKPVDIQASELLVPKCPG